MRTDFLPRKDTDLDIWAQNMANKLETDPQRFGVPEEMAAAFIAAQQAFREALAAVANRQLRSPMLVSTKNNTRELLETSARRVAALVRATPGVSDEQRIDLGLKVRKVGLTRVGVPTGRPIVRIVSAIGNQLELLLLDDENRRAARPFGVTLASVFTFVGPMWPTEPSQWEFRGNYTRCRCTIRMPGNTPPGSRVWCTAYWVNTRGEQSGMANAVCINLPGGEVLAA